MTGALSSTALDVRALARRILELQDADGRIAWIDAGIFDPWNHVECVLGLCVVDELESAHRGMAVLAESQDDTGAWDGEMGCAAPMDATGDRVLAANLPRVRDTNFVAYPAMGAWRLALAHGRARAAEPYGEMVARALDWVIAHQREDGAIVWRAPDEGERLETIGALHTGSASIYRSLEAGVRLLDALGRSTDHLQAARARLGGALRRASTRWLDKSEFAMDWYYPVISGALSVGRGRARLARRWRAFVQPGVGCRCVANEPWATAAETSELAIAAACARAPRLAKGLLATLAQCVTPSGDLWMGWQFREGRAWPHERPSWTAAAALIAMEVVEGRTAGARLFLETLPEPNLTASQDEFRHTPVA